MSLFVELSLLLAITTLISLVAKKLKQPLIVGYILAGMVAGPYGLNIVTSTHELELFSKVGIVFLLLIVGLHLNPKVIKEVGTVSLITGLGQVLFTSLIGFGISTLLGIEKIAAAYVAIALTFSSTIIILKLLADKQDLQKLYAKVAIGFLLVQDLVATMVLIGITVSTTTSSDGVLFVLAGTLLKGIALLSLLFFITRTALPRLISYVATSQELLFLFSLAWGTVLASLFAWLGFSIEIGALVAGVMLSTTHFADEIASRLKPIRDFFIIIFFILLGSNMILDGISLILFPAIVLSVFVLIGNPIIVILLMNHIGFKRKTGFLAGLTVAQISEFSLILASLGLSVGHISQEVLSLITLVGLITISGSTYLILYAESIYPKVKNLLVFLELLKKKTSEKGSVGEEYTYLLFGFDRVGDIFMDALQDHKKSVLVIDYNPASITKIESRDVAFRYGDAGDIEFLQELPVLKPEVVISTIPDLATNLLITKVMKEKNLQLITILLAHNTTEAAELYQAGASYVVIPHLLGAQFAGKLFQKHGSDPEAYANERLKQSHKFSITLS